jgi:hypothetical protein
MLTDREILLSLFERAQSMRLGCDDEHFKVVEYLRRQLDAKRAPLSRQLRAEAPFGA